MARMQNKRVSTSILPSWFDGEAGQDLLRKQITMLDTLVPDQFFRVGLQYGLSEHNVLSSMNVEYPIYSDRARAEHTRLDFVALPEALPR